MHSLKAGSKAESFGAESFSSAGFFSILRALGVNPRIHNGVVYRDTVVSDAVEHAYRWGNQHDPDGAHRRFYAREVWSARPPGTQTVELG